jgi:formyl-CoA transferase
MDGAARSKFEITTILRAVNFPSLSQHNSKEFAEDPQPNERDFFARLPHPAVATQTHARIPWILTNSPNGVRTAAPTLGQHTEESLHDLLHCFDDKIAMRARDGVLQ